MDKFEAWFQEHWMWVIGIGGAGLLGWFIFFRNKQTSNASTTQDTSALTPQYLIPMYGSGGNPDATVTGTTTGTSSGNQNPNSPSSQQQPFATPSADFGTLTTSGINTTTNPGYDTFHIKSNSLTVGALSQDIYPELSPTEALQQVEYYNPQLGSTPQVAQNVLSNNFLTVPTQAGEGVAASQQVKS